MEKLKDYSGKFRPHISWENFSEEIMLDVLKLYRNMFLAVDGFWYLTIKDRYGDETAMNIDLVVWDKFIRYELKRLTQFFHITGNDVETLFKAIQVSAWAGNMDIEIDLKSVNNGIMRVNRCHTLEALVKEGKGREKYFCRKVEQKMFDMYTRYFNPKMTANAIKLPPETLDSGICCEWEIALPQ
jgi:hypothetical protein